MSTDARMRLLREGDAIGTLDDATRATLKYIVWHGAPGGANDGIEAPSPDAVFDLLCAILESRPLVDMATSATTSAITTSDKTPVYIMYLLAMAAAGVHDVYASDYCVSLARPRYMGTGEYTVGAEMGAVFPGIAGAAAPVFGLVADSGRGCSSVKETTGTVRCPPAAALVGVCFKYTTRFHERRDFFDHVTADDAGDAVYHGAVLSDTHKARLSALFQRIAAAAIFKSLTSSDAANVRPYETAAMDLHEITTAAINGRASEGFSGGAAPRDRRDAAAILDGVIRGCADTPTRTAYISTLVRVTELFSAALKSPATYDRVQTVFEDAKKQA